MQVHIGSLFVLLRVAPAGDLRHMIPKITQRDDVPEGLRFVDHSTMTQSSDSMSV